MARVVPAAAGHLLGGNLAGFAAGVRPPQVDDAVHDLVDDDRQALVTGAVPVGVERALDLLAELVEPGADDDVELGAAPGVGEGGCQGGSFRRIMNFAYYITIKSK